MDRRLPTSLPVATPRAIAARGVRGGNAGRRLEGNLKLPLWQKCDVDLVRAVEQLRFRGLRFAREPEEQLEPLVER